MFKLREFKDKQSIVRSAIKDNKLHNLNCCYTKAGKSYNAEEYERMMQAQIGPSSNKSQKGVFSIAGSAVINKKDIDLYEEESRLIEEYYK